MTIRKIYRICFYIFILQIISPFLHTANSAVYVSLPELTGINGSDVAIPVVVTNVYTEEIYSVGMKITFNPTVLEAKEIITTGTLLESWGNPITNINDGTILLGAAGSSPLAGNGVMFYIHFTVTGLAGTSTDISFTTMVFNEGNPEAITNIGKYTVVEETAGSILSVSPDTLKFYATCGKDNPADQVIQIINAGTGLLKWEIAESIDWLSLSQYSGTGHDSVNVSVDINDLNAGTFSDSVVFTATGADSSPVSVFIILKIEPKVVTIVSMPDSSFAPNTRFALPVIISDITGLDISSISFALTFSPIILEASGVNTKGTISEIWGTPTVNIINGEVKVNIEGLTPLTGSGTLFWVDFHVLGSGGSSCVIRINEFLLNRDTSPDSIKNSNIYITIPDNIKENDAKPGNYYIWQNYPNPFNPVTSIKYHIPEPSDIKINIYNLRGEIVKNLFQEYRHAGVYEITWNGDDNYNRQVPSGIYYCRFESNNYIQTRVMTFIK